MRPHLLLVGFALSARAGASPHAGKVVRVERGSRTAPGIPRICLEVHDDGQGPVGTCLGPQPAIGSIVELVDDTHVFGQVRISEVNRFQGACTAIWNIKGVLASGDLAPLQSGRAAGIIDGGLDARGAHRIADDMTMASPSGHTEDHVQLAVDRDGKGREGLVLTLYSCDAQGQPAAIGPTQCMDLWRTGAGHPTRTQQILFGGCF